MVLPLKVKNLFQEEQLLSFSDLIPIQKGGKNESGRVASLKVYPFTLIAFIYYGCLLIYFFFQETASRLSPAVSERVLQLQSGCQKLRDQGYSFTGVPRSQLKHLIVNDEHRVMYCYIPKVACTNLKRVFLLLTGKMNETEPLKLKSSDVHLTYTKYLTFLNTYSEEDIIYKIQNYRKVIFVREPLERLLSAYRNKFTQKGGVYFQERFGRKIIRLFRENPSVESLDHGDDVTFREFVQFLLDPDTEPNGFNEHWAPMSSLCHPCHISYDFIGKYESLDDDVSLLLKEMSVYDQINFPERGDTYKTERTEDTMLEHFQTIPSQYLQDIWKLYLQDYILFGYPYPQVIRKLLNGQ